MNDLGIVPWRFNKISLYKERDQIFYNPFHLCMVFTSSGILGLFLFALGFSSFPKHFTYFI